MKRILLTLCVFLLSTNCWSATFDYYATSAPSNCSLGEMWFDSDATQGYNINVCTSTDVWTPLFTDIANNIGIGTSFPNGSLIVMNGKVGIGTWSPIGQLEVKGGSSGMRIWTGAGTNTNANAAGELYVEGDLEVDGTIYGDGSGITALPSGLPAGGWTDGGTNVFTTTTTDNVGIGTTTPTSTVEIVKTAAGTAPLMVSTTATADGDLLIVHSGGNVGIGTVEPIAKTVVENTAAIDSLRVNDVTADSSPFVIDQNGNVGIGTSTASDKMIVTGGNVGIGTNSANVALLNVNGETYIAGPVGMGTFTPTGMLDVRQDEVRIWTGAGTDTNATAAGELYVEGDLEVDGTIYGDGSGITSLSSSLPAGGWVDGGTNVYQVTTTDLVGIGTTSPSTTFEIVQQGTNPPMMVSSAFNADGNLLIVHSGGNVGIGTVEPIAKAVVENTAAIDSLRVNDVTADSSPFVIDQNGNVGIGTSTASDKMIVTGGNVGIGTNSANVALLNVNGETYIAGPVGMGTFTPTGMLDVRQDEVRIWTGAGTDTNATAAGELYVEGDLEVDGTIYGDGSGITALPSTLAAGGWVDGGTNVYQVTTTDLVGIGTTSPSTTLEIVQQGTNPALMVSSVFNGDGNLLIVHSGGNVGIGTTQPIAKTVIENTAAIDSLRVNDVTNDSSPFVIDQNGNVGIGTSTANEKVIITGGNVGIGTTISNNNVLSVNGGAYIAGNVGIGTLYPSGGGILDVRQDEVRIWTGAGTDTNATAGGELYVEGDLEVDGTIYGDGSGITALPSTLPAGGWTDGGTNVYTTTTTDNVGIGTTTPTSTVEIVKTAAGTAPLMVSTTATADGDLLIVHSGGNVGIGTVQPIAKAVVENTAAIDSLRVNDVTADSSPFVIDQNGNVGIGTSTASDKMIVTGGNVGIGTSSANVAILSVNGETYIAGPVGMGTFTPTGMLDVRQDEVRIWTGAGTDTNATAAGELYVEGDLEVDGTIYGDGSGITALPSTLAAGGWVDGGTNVYNTATTDFVGVGTTSPSTTLEIVEQGTNPALMVSSVFNGDGDMLIVHSSGNIGIGTMQPIAKTVVENTAAIDSFRVNDVTNDSSPFVIDQNGNVGVGTTTAPGLFTVIGNVGIGTTTPYRTITPPANGMIVEGNVGIGTFAANSGKLLVMGGNVGIGTVTPQAPLQIYSATSQKWLKIGNVPNPTTGAGAGGIVIDVNDPAGSGVFMSDSVNGLYGKWEIYQGALGVGSISNHPVNFFSNDQIRMSISPGGFVGIGTTTPSSLLTVDGNVAIGTTLPYRLIAVPLNGMAVEGNVGIGTWVAESGKLVVMGGNVSIGTVTPVGALTVMNGNVGIGTWSPIGIFQARTASGTPFLIDAGGNVGIGTTSISTTTAAVSIMNGNVGIGTWNPIGRFQINRTTGGTPFIVDPGGNVGIGTTFVDTTSAAVSIMNGNVGIGTYNPIQKLDVIGAGRFTGSGDSYLNTGGGNVGIGTISPSGFKLDVNGKIRSTSTTDIGWTVVNVANQACNTTCTSACVFGINTAALGNLLACTDATADSCLCAGGS